MIVSRMDVEFENYTSLVADLQKGQKSTQTRVDTTTASTSKIAAFSTKLPDSTSKFVESTTKLTEFATKSTESKQKINYETTNHDAELQVNVSCSLQQTKQNCPSKNKISFLKWTIYGVIAGGFLILILIVYVVKNKLLRNNSNLQQNDEEVPMNISVKHVNG